MSTASTEDGKELTQDSITDSPREAHDENWELYECLESMSEATAEFETIEHVQAGLPLSAALVNAFVTEAGVPTASIDDFGEDVDGCGSDSVHTVCKDYGDTMATQTTQHPPEDFVTWCKSHSISQVVRVNFCNEPGLKNIGGSYSSITFEANGISHLDVPVHDHGGGVPDVASICEVMEACKLVPDNQARLIHCKGGFGRSVLMACCCLISDFDVPGSALLGWVRIARPGAITTIQQEHFLRQFRGAADLERYLQAGGTTTAAPGCCTVS